MPQKQLKTKLVDCIRKYAYREGDFTLASGQKSSYYVDCKQVTLHPEGADTIAKLLWEVLDPKDYGGVGGPTMGADPLATAMSLEAWRRGVFVPAFILRKEPKKHGTSKWIEGQEHLDASKPILVVEDVVTTGGSSLTGIEKLRAAGFTVDTLVCVLDREQGGGAALSLAKVKLVPLCTIAEIKNSR